MCHVYGSYIIYTICVQLSVYRGSYIETSHDYSQITESSYVAPSAKARVSMAIDFIYYRTVVYKIYAMAYSIRKRFIDYNS